MKNEFEIFENAYILRLSREYKSKKIMSKFFTRMKDNIFEEKHIMLWPFVDTAPFKYIKPEVYNKLLSFLTDNTEIAINSILDHGFDMTKAILTFYNIHSLLNSEDSISQLTSETIYNFDTVYHLEYIKNTEHVYGRLISIVISMLEEINGKDYKSQGNLSNKLDILRSNNFETLTECSNSTIRNAISHGTVYYETNMIIFFNRDSEERLSPYEYIKMIDDLLDTCASLLFAFIVFILDTDKILISPGIPDGIIFIYLSSLLGYEHFKFVNILPYRIIGNKKQLVFFVKTDSNSRGLHQFESIKLAYFLNTRFKHNFSRIAINIDSGKSISPSMFIDLDKLNSTIKNNSFADIGNSIDASLLWHDESKFRRMIWFYKNFFFYQKEKTKNDFITNYCTSMGINYYGDRYIIKRIEDRSSTKVGRIFIHVVLNRDINDLLEDVEKFIDMLLYIIKTHKMARKLRVYGLSDRTKKVSPIYIWGSLYKQDTRARNLHLNDNKICDFEWIRNAIKYNPILLKNTDETKGIRIKFSRQK
jgi:hypothetical protein